MSVRRISASITAEHVDGRYQTTIAIAPNAEGHLGKKMQPSERPKGTDVKKLTSGFATSAVALLQVVCSTQRSMGLCVYQIFVHHAEQRLSNDSENANQQIRCAVFAGNQRFPRAKVANPRLRCKDKSGKRWQGGKPMTPFEIAMIILMLPSAIFGALLMFLLMVAIFQTIGGRDD